MKQVAAQPARWTGTSYDHTGFLGRIDLAQVKFLEQAVPLGQQITGAANGAVDPSGGSSSPMFGSTASARGAWKRVRTA